MTTTTLHSNVQRSRFTQHALAALSGLTASLFGAPLRSAALGAGFQRRRSCLA